ncbi:MAG TPA: UDP-N-acetylglucosamine 4,6-dehydratase (inverting) [Candidatus Omnitrophota bacterium]|nr:UDP-N-acetylglucosamine 4,6-dehydratase (inverting) [Candidatus Omnitrophota bacterium]HPD84111.1 UDP-N-acetylglucosamine 4,6-dehydratase (inverting) [Candidatus Omnitrophota bacterium]HRZ02968.1 UDP-N-acetylglucosamine 4,6-dehydratase (inverting) [Candidatus Omnitrophota bacterium]
MLNNKTILITGGTGSLGKKLVQIILQEYKPAKLIIFSRDELKQFEMAQKWDPNKYPCLRYMIGDVRDRDRLKMAFNGVDYVIHAAALKHVPKGEYDPEEFIKTNVLGAMSVIDAALDANVKKIVALSTDKACNPINLYGATKLCADKLFTAANVYSGGRATRFAVVRYGNVLGSRGSVIPFFKERVKTGVLPITDERMTRFWITLGQAAHFVLESLSKSKGGEIFVPRIPSMKIVDLAKAIGPTCKIKIIGVRPGEKIHEILISEDEARNAVQFKECYIVQSNSKLQKDLLKGGPGRGRLCPEGFKYTSETNSDWLTVKELTRLVDQIADDYTIEKSRWSMNDVPQ